MMGIDPTPYMIVSDVICATRCVTLLRDSRGRLNGSQCGYIIYIGPKSENREIKHTLADTEYGSKKVRQDP